MEIKQVEESLCRYFRHIRLRSLLILNINILLYSHCTYCTCYIIHVIIRFVLYSYDIQFMLRYYCTLFVIYFSYVIHVTSCNSDVEKFI